MLDANLDTFRKCAQKGLILSRNTSISDIVYVACASAYSHFGTLKGLRQAQKNIFTYPANVESWANFIAAVLPRSVRIYFTLISVFYIYIYFFFVESCTFSPLLRVSVYRCIDNDSKVDSQWIRSLISKITSQLKISEYMSKWLNSAQRIALISESSENL